MVGIGVRQREIAGIGGPSGRGQLKDCRECITTAGSSHTSTTEKKETTSTRGSSGKKHKFENGCKTEEVLMINMGGNQGNMFDEITWWEVDWQ